MNFSLFLPLLFGLQCFYWYIGRRSSKKIEGQEDYFLAKKSVGFFPLMMTFIAAQVGGGLVLGAADAAYTYGWWVLLYPLGTCLGLLSLGLGLGRRLAEFGVSTMAQILEVVYKSPVLKKIASILSVISLFMILSAQFIASQKFLTAVGLGNPFVFALFWGIVVLYTVRGGFRAVISTDIAQASLFALIFALSFGWIFFSGTAPAFSLAVSSFALSSSKLTGWLLMPLLYMMIEQDMGQRCFAANSPRTVSKATFWAGIGTMIICIVPIAFGILAKTAGLAIPPGSSTLMTSVAYATNPIVASFVGCAILAAIISTATSIINAISSNLSLDFEIFRKKQNLKSARILSLIISVGALIAAFFFNDVVGILIQSYELFVSAIFIPTIFALFKKRGNFLSALLSILFGITGFFLFKIIAPPFPAEIANILLSLSGYITGEVLMRLPLLKKGESALRLDLIQCKTALHWSLVNSPLLD